jgi:uncharacterized protein YndB with AHSA1/START domain
MDRTIRIDAPPDTVFALVSDPVQTPRWSPECVGCRWIGGARRPEVGARYRGTCRNGWRRWTTTSTIRAVEADTLFVWDVTYLGMKVARWSYRLQPTGGGTTLTESVDDQRGRLLRTLSPHITGSRDRASRNADTMDTTLEAIKSAAEAAMPR